MDHGDRFHARGTGPSWPGATGSRCRVQEVTWTARDGSAQSRVLRDVTLSYNLVKKKEEIMQFSWHDEVVLQGVPSQGR